MKKKVLSVVLSSSLLAGILAGCAQTAAPAAPAAQPAQETAAGSDDVAAAPQASAESSGDVIELVFPCTWVGADSKADAWAAIVDSFNEEYAGK